jgi:hypothetical protein
MLINNCKKATVKKQCFFFKKKTQINSLIRYNLNERNHNNNNNYLHNYPITTNFDHHETNIIVNLHFTNE